MLVIKQHVQKIKQLHEVGKLKTKNKNKNTPWVHLVYQSGNGYKTWEARSFLVFSF